MKRVLVADDGECDMTQTRQPRPGRPEIGPFVHNRLADEVERLKMEPAWHDGDRNAITLTKRAGLRLVLTVLRQGAVLREHRAPTAVTLHVISGRMVVRVGDRSLELGPGEVVTMEPGLTHAGEARADTAFLLTLVEGDR
jgi:quercetin dioxygenase-like cupin family protein